MVRMSIAVLLGISILSSVCTPVETFVVAPVLDRGLLRSSARIPALRANMQIKEFSSEQMEFQWSTMKKNFDATWKGKSEWYRKGEKPALDFTAPTQVKEDTQYDITFENDVEGTWTGTGLGMTDEKVVLPLALTGYNQAANVDAWGFPGAGGQCSVQIDFSAARFATETNFFQDRSRSMLVAVYMPTADKKALLLNAVNAVAFRDQRASPPDGPRKVAGGAEALLQSIQGWKGMRMGAYDPRKPPTKFDAPADIGVFDASAIAKSDVCRCFQDNLICGIPDRLSGSMYMYFGCQTTPSLFKLITYSYDAAGRFCFVSLDHFSP